MITTAFFDPSARSGKQHDFKAIVVGSLVNAIYYVRYAFIRRCTVQTVLEQLYLIDTRFPGVLIGFEENGFQVLYKDLLDYKAREKGYPIRVHGMTSTGNKEARIEGLSGFVENGAILFQKEKKGYTSDIGILVEQMLDFPNGAHDDGPDALKYAFDLARDKARKAAYASKRKVPKQESRVLNRYPEDGILTPRPKREESRLRRRWLL